MRVKTETGASGTRPRLRRRRSSTELLRRSYLRGTPRIYESLLLVCMSKGLLSVCVNEEGGGGY